MQQDAPVVAPLSNLPAVFNLASFPPQFRRRLPQHSSHRLRGEELRSEAARINLARHQNPEYLLSESFPHIRRRSPKQIFWRGPAGAELISAASEFSLLRFLHRQSPRHQQLVRDFLARLQQLDSFSLLPLLDSTLESEIKDEVRNMCKSPPT